MSSPVRSSRSSTPNTPSRDYTDTTSDIELTPRSKIKALLNQFDDSDSEQDAIQKPSLTYRPKKTKLPVVALSSTTKLQDVNVSEDEGDVPAPRPRGKLAARMMAQAQTMGGVNPSKTLKQTDAGSAVDRVRESIFGNKSDKKIESLPEPEHKEPSDDSDEEKIVPVRRRKKLNKSKASPLRPQAQLVEKSIISGESTPGSTDGQEINKSQGNVDRNSDDDDLPTNLFKDDTVQDRVERLKQLAAHKRAKKEKEDAEKEAKRKALEEEILEGQDSASSGDDEALARSTERPKSRKVCAVIIPPPDMANLSLGIKESTSGNGGRATTTGAKYDS